MGSHCFLFITVCGDCACSLLVKQGKTHLAILRCQLLGMRYEKVGLCHTAGEVIPITFNGLRRSSCSSIQATDPYIEKQTRPSLVYLVIPYDGTA